MRHLLRLLVLVALLGIVASLGWALYQLARGSAESSARLARALTLRISLSLLLFLLLMLAWYFGLIAPHGLQGGGAPR